MKKYAVLYITLGMSLIAHAQDNQEATYDYEPNLVAAKKMLIDPRVPKNTGSEINLSYSPNEYKYSIRPSVTLAPPTKYVDPLLDTTYNPNYVRLGGGNYGHKLGELYISNRANSKFAHGLAIQHLSADENKSIRDFSNNRAYLWGSRFFGRSSITARLHYEREMYRFYGSDTSYLVDLNKQPKKIGTSIGGNVVYDLKGLDRRPGLNVGVHFNNYDNTLNQSELEYGAKVGWNAKLSQIQLLGDLSFTQLNFRQKFRTTNQSIIKFTPKVKFHSKENNLEATVGFDLTYIAGEKEPYINPVIYAEKKLEGLKMLVYGGITGGLQINSVRRFAQLVPFSYDSLAIKNSFEEIRGYAGLKGKITENSQFNIEMGGNAIYDMPLVVTNFDTLNSSNLVYDKLSNFWFSGGLRVSVGEKLRLGGNFKVNNYDLANEIQAWNLPSSEYGVSAQYTLNKMFVFDLGLNGIGNWYNKDLVTKTSREINGFLDLHARIDYKFKNLARIWVQGTNLLNTKYQRFYGYNAYGTAIMGGISASF